MGFQKKIQEIDILIGKFVNQSWQNPDISLKRPKEAMVNWNESFLLNKNPTPFNEFGLSEPVLRTSTTLKSFFSNLDMMNFNWFTTAKILFQKKWDAGF